MRYETREDFEHRVLALLRDRLDECDETYGDANYDVGDFMIVYQIYEDHPPPEPWHGGPYAGWIQDVHFVTSSPSWWIDEALLTEALAWVRQKRFDKWNADLAAEEKDEDEDEDDEE
jgi:hypothetical protein